MSKTKAGQRLPVSVDYGCPANSLFRAFEVRSVNVDDEGNCNVVSRESALEISVYSVYRRDRSSGLALWVSDWKTDIEALKEGARLAKREEQRCARRGD